MTNIFLGNVNLVKVNIKEILQLLLTNKAQRRKKKEEKKSSTGKQNKKKETTTTEYCSKVFPIAYKMNITYESLIFNLATFRRIMYLCELHISIHGETVQTGAHDTE